MRGFISRPFGAFRGDGTGRQGRHANLFRLVFLPDGRILATLSRYRDCKALAADLARTYLREEAPPPRPAL